MRRGPSEKKRECAGSSEPWHCLQWCRLTDRAEAAGDSPAGARVWDEVRAPPGAQHSASFKAITARQLQALVRRRLSLDFRVRRRAAELLNSAIREPSDTSKIQIERASSRTSVLT